MFSAIAPKYDFLNRLLSARIDVAWRDKTVRLTPPPVEGPLLDVCTGTGDLAIAYLRKHPDRFLFASDFCLPMLEVARKKYSWNLPRSPLLLEADTLRLPFESNYFAQVSVAFGLRNTQEPRLALQEMRRVVKPGGGLVILEFAMPKWPIIGPAYRWYFNKVLPRIGQWLSRSPDSAYAYLPESVGSFPQGEEMLSWIREAGWDAAKYRYFTFGIAALYTAKKPLG